MKLFRTLACITFFFLGVFFSLTAIVSWLYQSNAGDVAMGQESISISDSESSSPSSAATSSSSSSPNSESSQSSSSNPPNTESAQSSSSNPPNTESAQSSSSNSPNTESAQSSSSNSPNTESAQSSSSNSPNTESAQSSSSNSPNTESAQSSSSNSPNTESAQSSSSNSPNTESAQSSSSNSPNTESAYGYPNPMNYGVTGFPIATTPSPSERYSNPQISQSYGRENSSAPFIPRYSTPFSYGVPNSAAPLIPLYSSAYSTPLNYGVPKILYSTNGDISQEISGRILPGLSPNQWLLQTTEGHLYQLSNTKKVESILISLVGKNATIGGQFKKKFLSKQYPTFDIQSLAYSPSTAFPFDSRLSSSWNNGPIPYTITLDQNGIPVLSPSMYQFSQSLREKLVLRQPQIIILQTNAPPIYLMITDRATQNGLQIISVAPLNPYNTADANTGKVKTLYQ